MTETNASNITKAMGLVKPYTFDVIEATVIDYICKQTNNRFSYVGEYEAYKDLSDPTLESYLDRMGFPIDIEFIIEFFEALLEKDNVIENGIVFTPKYISDYICKSIYENDMLYSHDINIIDPGCGCGIFLASAVEAMHKKYDISYCEILNNNIYGLELDADNARRCKIVLNLFVMMHGEDNAQLKLNIKCIDSLKINWNEELGVDGFSYIIGNPPYVNTHDMNKETCKFLKDNFKTTRTGVYNIFYAFIEYAMVFLKEDGKLGYIIPNNFLTIKSATDLRIMLASNLWVEHIIDFADNMVFKPVRTYNCIIRLSKNKNADFEYCVMEKVDDISKGLSEIEFEKMSAEKLDENGWKLIDHHTMKNIQKLECQFRCIKDFVRTGIATLRDEVYIVEKDEIGFYKNVDGVRYDIEDTIAKRLYKIPDLKKSDSIRESCKYIIFPYQKGQRGFEIIPEDILSEQYPLTYRYLVTQRKELDSRDKGKPNTVTWYAYGRTQGLNKYGKKLVFPTFASKPKFTMIDDEYALFCNGYAIFDNDYLDLDIIRRILNSCLMQYYISNTSYAIEGGYYCYQKKYIERFSIPLFTEKEKADMLKMNDEELDSFLIDRYEIEI